MYKATHKTASKYRLLDVEHELESKKTEMESKETDGK